MYQRLSQLQKLYITRPYSTQLRSQIFFLIAIVLAILLCLRILLNIINDPFVHVAYPVLLAGLIGISYLKRFPNRTHIAELCLIVLLLLSPYAAALWDSNDVSAQLILTGTLIALITCALLFEHRVTAIFFGINLIGICVVSLILEQPIADLSFNLLSVGFSGLMIVLFAYLRDLNSARIQVLMESEARLSTLFEAAFETILIHDDAYIIDINRAGEELFGFKKSDIIGMHLSDLLVRTLSIPMLDTLNREDLVPFESVGLHKSGEVFPVEVLTRAYDYRGQLVSVSAIRDITYRKKMEARLRRQIETEQIIANMSRLFAEITPDDFDDAINASLELIGDLAGVDRAYAFVLKDNGKTLDHIYSWQANRADENFAMLQPGPLEGWGWWMNHLVYRDHIAVNSLKDLPEDANAEKVIFEAGNVKSLLAVPLMYRQELIGFIGVDATKNERHWSHEDVSLLQITAELFVNVMERTRTELALRQSEQRFSLIFRSSPVPICILTLDDGRFVDMNDSFLELIGYTRDEISGKTTTAIHLWTEPNTRLNFIELLQESPVLRGSESSIRRKDGSTRDLLVSIEKIIIDHQELLLVLALDITERKLAEKQVQDLYLERERVRVLNTFIKDISHDFKTPLSVMRTSVYLIKKRAERSGDTPDWLSNVDDIDLQITRMQNMVNDFIMMARLERSENYNLYPGDLNNLTMLIINRRKTTFDERQQTVNIEMDTNIPEIPFDSEAMGQVIDRLLMNAALYSQDKTEITVRTRANGNYAIIEVEDNGMGISEADLPHIFERLYRANKARTSNGAGSGLGLPIARQVVQIHHGSIEVESEVDAGTTFRVRIPYQQPDIAPELSAVHGITKDE
ncbi:MAG: PAS domain S-box protein [Aggregatilineales bacterium]